MRLLIINTNGFHADIVISVIWPIGWNWSTDFFCRLIRVYIGLRQYFSEGVQNFVH